jgi:hypothetical protein
MTTRAQPVAVLAPILLPLFLGLGACSAAVESPAAVAPAPTAATTPALTAVQRQPYLGSYSITTPEGERITFRIYEENGVLKGQPGAEEPVRLVYLGDNLFRTEGQYNYTVTFILENGRATRFTARSGDTVLQGVRIP